MDRELEKLFEQAIQIELGVARLYGLFATHYPEDEALWMQLSKEELNHSAMMESGRREFWEERLFPAELLCGDLEAMEEANRWIEHHLALYRREPPDRCTALRKAIELESMAAELHYQETMQISEPSSEALRLFQRLNADDKDHARRLEEYLREHCE